MMNRIELALQGDRADGLEAFSRYSAKSAVRSSDSRLEHIGVTKERVENDSFDFSTALPRGVVQRHRDTVTPRAGVLEWVERAL
jgi:hypothetical protein